MSLIKPHSHLTCKGENRPGSRMVQYDVKTSCYGVCIKSTESNVSELLLKSDNASTKGAFFKWDEWQKLSTSSKFILIAGYKQNKAFRVLTPFQHELLQHSEINTQCKSSDLWRYKAEGPLWRIRRIKINITLWNRCTACCSRKYQLWVYKDFSQSQWNINLKLGKNI